MSIDLFDLRSWKWDQSMTGQYGMKNLDIYSDMIAGMLSGTTKEKIGTVSDVLTDKLGQIQYLVIELGGTGTGRKVMLSGDRAYLDEREGRVYASGLTREQAEHLPAYTLSHGIGTGIE